MNFTRCNDFPQAIVGPCKWLRGKSNVSVHAIIVCILVGCASQVVAQDTLRTGNFSAPDQPQIVKAIPATGTITVDGKLDELDWQNAPVTDDFFMMEPRQAGEIHYKTAVRVLFDDKSLYFGVFCADSLGPKGVRVQDLRRDFVFGENDMFFVQLDPQNLKRFCVSFQTTPYGNQRDLQAFNGDFIDEDWDARWKVRTTITADGYFAEFAIPFASLRYEKGQQDTVSWGITFSRLARRDYEQTVFPPIPQAFDPYRMTYAAQLQGLKLPPPSTNIQIQPYLLFQNEKARNELGITTQRNALRIGGELKWAINPHAVLDLTVNTDFAQADVDRAVNNTGRFNVFFPERRQFFLENRGVYAGTNVDGINPFFSRTVGLANAQFNAESVPIDAGLRFTDRTQKRTFAALYVHQRGTQNQAGANLSVLRYLRNYGKQNNIGLMLTHRLDENNRSRGVDAKNNTTLTLDGLNRPTDSWTITYLLSASRNNRNDSIGLAGHMSIGYAPQNWYWGYTGKFTDQKYLPGMGFVFANNTIHHNPGGYFIWRPKGKLGKWIRRWDPGVFVNWYQNTNDLATQEVSFYIFPVYITTSSNALIEYSVFPTLQRYNFPLSILDREIPIGNYNVNRHFMSYSSDASRKISLGATYEFGGYFNGQLDVLSCYGRIAPLPQLAFTGSFERNHFRNFGTLLESFTTNLSTIGLRVAVNPRIQLSTFYQYNSFDKQGRWNLRGSWEFTPLSFLYLVFNENGYTDNLSRNQSLICKVSYLKQF
jgi:hypothetical protein